MMTCPYCGAEAVLVDSSKIYHTGKYHGKMWVCSNYPKCDSYVGCHPNTTRPLGRLSNARLRCLKTEAHKQFDPLWKSGLMYRREAYAWLASVLDIPQKDCHIDMFDIKMCQKVIHLCRSMDDRLLQKYREKHYMNRTFTFSRGYPRRKSR